GARETLRWEKQGQKSKVESRIGFCKTIFYHKWGMYGRSPGAPQVWSLAKATQKVAGACQSAAIKRSLMLKRRSRLPITFLQNRLTNGRLPVI
ncbi:MAG: hypothetical protein WBI94_03950, partial [Candidatus Cloacimonadaceae bacterium]